MANKLYKVNKSNQIVSEQEVINSAVNKALSEKRIQKVGDKLMFGEQEVTPEQIRDSYIKKYPDAVTEVKDTTISSIGEGIVKRAERGLSNIPQQGLEAVGVAPAVRLIKQTIPGGEQPLSTGDPLKTGAAIAGDVGQVMLAPVGGLKGIAVGAATSVGMDVSGISDAVRYISSNIQNAPSDLQTKINQDLNVQIKTLRENVKATTPEGIKKKEDAMSKIKGIQGLLKVTSNMPTQFIANMDTAVLSTMFDLAPTVLLGSLSSKAYKGAKTEKQILNEVAELNNTKNIIDTIKNEEYDKIQKDILTGKNLGKSSMDLADRISNNLAAIGKKESESYASLMDNLKKTKIDVMAIDVLKNSIKKTLGEYDIDPTARAVGQGGVTATIDPITNKINKYYKEIDRAKNLAEVETIGQKLGQDIDQITGGKRSAKDSMILQRIDNDITAFTKAQIESKKYGDESRKIYEQTKTSYAKYSQLKQELDKYLSDKSKPEDFVDKLIEGGGSRGLGALSDLMESANKYLDDMKRAKWASEIRFKIRTAGNRRFGLNNADAITKRTLEQHAIDRGISAVSDTSRNVEMLILKYIKDKSFDEMNRFKPSGFAKAINRLNKASNNNITKFFSPGSVKDIAAVQNAVDRVKVYETLSETKPLSTDGIQNIAIGLDKISSGIPVLNELINAGRFDSMQYELNLLKNQGKLTNLFPVGQEGRVALRAGITATQEQKKREKDAIPLMSKEDREWNEKLKEARKQIKERSIKQKVMNYKKPSK